MSESNKVCVVIPVHKPVPTSDELLSLGAARDKLGAYPCYLLYPQGMDISAYIKTFPMLIALPVDAAWLASVQAYNKMKLNPAFYRLFKQYAYMLTYELDAYIFSAGFEKAGAFDFDFIGAPFFKGYWAAQPGDPLISGCNSGFSMRNIQSCIRVFDEMSTYRFKWLLHKLLLSHSSRLRRWLNNVTRGKFEIYISGKFGFAFGDFHLNEDLVWTEIIPQMFPWFKIADPMSALKFSFEYNLNDSLLLTNNQLPLGCHAWFKHTEFWRKYIDMSRLNDGHAI